MQTEITERRALADGTPVLLRPVRPSDADLLVAGFERLSPESRYRRFFGQKRALSPAEIEYFTRCDGSDHFAVAAVVERPGGEEGVGVARFIRAPGEPLVAEAAVTVIDAFQHNGLGSLLLKRLLSAARERGVRDLQFLVLSENRPMLSLLRELAPGAQATPDPRFGGLALSLVARVPAADEARS